MIFWRWLWLNIKRVPAGLWLGLSLLGAGFVYGMRLMAGRVKIRDIKQGAQRKRERLQRERDDLRDAAKTGSGASMREEVLKNLRDEQVD